MTSMSPETQKRIETIEASLTPREKRPVAYTDDVLQNITGFESAMALLAQDYSEPDSLDNYGSGFAILPTDEKARLVSVPMIALQWVFNTGENGEFVSAHVVTKHGERLIINDGSTGIYRQLKDVTDRRLARGVDAVRAHNNLFIPHGLKRSEYSTTDAAGKAIRGVTFYLA